MSATKGNLRPGKVNKNYRIYANLVEKVEEEAKLRGLDNAAPMLNFILNERYYGPTAIDMNALRQKGN